MYSTTQYLTIYVVFVGKYANRCIKFQTCKSFNDHLMFTEKENSKSWSILSIEKRLKGYNDYLAKRV